MMSTRQSVCMCNRVSRKLSGSSSWDSITCELLNKAGQPGPCSVTRQSSGSFFFFEEVQTEITNYSWCPSWSFPLLLIELLPRYRLSSLAQLVGTFDANFCAHGSVAQQSSDRIIPAATVGHSSVYKQRIHMF